MKNVSELVERGEVKETILQFGEGNFLRAFVDWMIDLSNEKDKKPGNVVIVQPIDVGLVDLINEQKGIYTSETFQKHRKESLENIRSSQGIEERLNRSIQAEGEFSKIKSGLNYNRFHHRGKENIISEISLLSIALNLNKLASKIENKNLEIIKYKAA